MRAIVLLFRRFVQSEAMHLVRPFIPFATVARSRSFVCRAAESHSDATVSHMKPSMHAQGIQISSGVLELSSVTAKSSQSDQTSGN